MSDNSAVVAVFVVFLITFAFIFLLHNLSRTKVSYRDEIGKKLVEVDTKIKTIDCYLNDPRTNDHQIELLKTQREITIKEKEKILAEYEETVRREHEEDVWKFLAR